jgi:hypothetical protein
MLLYILLSGILAFTTIILVQFEDPISKPISIITGIFSVGFTYCAIRWWKHYNDEQNEIDDILNKRGKPTLPKEDNA